jgi:N-acetylneuraminate synthase
MVEVVAEIGINANGDILKAFDLIDVAIECGCDYVKFQKRVPKLAVPESQWNKEKETPWGLTTYLEYKEKLEFRETDYHNLHLYCKGHIKWFASCWDIPSLQFIDKFNVPYIKIPSACLTEDELLQKALETNKEIILSTGMSTIDEIDHAVEILGKPILLHCTSTYPAKPEELNLLMIPALKKRYGCRVGYSGHEVGLSTTIAAVALGAEMVERHITLDRAMWGTDQAASVESQGLRKLVRDIRNLEKAVGDGIKKVYPSEIPVRAKLRKCD